MKNGDPIQQERYHGLLPQPIVWKWTLSPSLCESSCWEGKVSCLSRISYLGNPQVLPFLGGFSMTYKTLLCLKFSHFLPWVFFGGPKVVGWFFFNHRNINIPWTSYVGAKLITCFNDGNPYHGYINTLRNWIDCHYSLLFGNHGHFDPGTYTWICGVGVFFLDFTKVYESPLGRIYLFLFPSILFCKPKCKEWVH